VQLQHSTLRIREKRRSKYSKKMQLQHNTLHVRKQLRFKCSSRSSSAPDSAALHTHPRMHTHTPAQPSRCDWPGRNPCRCQQKECNACSLSLWGTDAQVCAVHGAAQRSWQCYSKQRADPGTCSFRSAHECLIAQECMFAQRRVCVMACL